MDGDRLPMALTVYFIADGNYSLWNRFNASFNYHLVRNLTHKSIRNGLICRWSCTIIQMVCVCVCATKYGHCLKLTEHHHSKSSDLKQMHEITTHSTQHDANAIYSIVKMCLFVIISVFYLTPFSCDKHILRWHYPSFWLL